MKKILLIVDVPNWAWAHKAQAIKKYLENNSLIIHIKTNNQYYNPNDYHHIHTFSFQLSSLSNYNSSTTVASYNFELKQNINIELNKINAFKKIICVSPLIYNKLVSYGISSQKLFKCYNGVDETLFYPINRQYPLKRPIVIGWCGQPAQKGDQHGFQIIEQVIKILENNNNFIFNINAKNYTTAIPFNKMNEEYYNKIDIIIHTGLATGTPNTVYEAVASGAFAMGTKIGCMEELITHNVNGYLFDKPNISNKNTFGNKQEIINCSKQIVDKLLYLNNNREVIKNFAIKLRQNILNNWTWKKRSQDWLPIIL